MQMMTAEIKPVNRFHPLKFMMWLGIAGMVMLFAALTSAYLVRKAQGDWLEFRIPFIFWINTAVILLSSVSMHLAVKAFAGFNVKRYRLAITGTLVLGILFLIGQYIGWIQLDEGGIHLTGNPSGSYLYVISGVHAAHIAVGVLIMFFGVLRAFFRPFNPNRLVYVQVMAIYWHFVDILWIYLFVFFQINLA